MFTGLIQDIGTIKEIDTSCGDARYEIATNIDLTSVQIGASIACSGVCLTVIEKTQSTFITEVSKETLNKTTFGALKVMDRINIEPSLRLGDEMGGHIVSGHVDTTATIRTIEKEGESHRIQIEMPPGFAQFIAPKGSVALDGISLTVNEVTQTHFGVNIIPHTWMHTTLSDRKPGDLINLEIDMLARYVARQSEVKNNA